MDYAVSQGVALGWYALPLWGITAPRNRSPKPYQKHSYAVSAACSSVASVCNCSGF